MSEDRPLADPEREDFALQIFNSFPKMSAEEYAARYGHTIGCSSLDQYRYSDAALGTWIDTLHRLLRSAAELERCRRVLLTPEEYDVIQREIADGEKYGL
jgi:hypothetical protein